MVFKKSKKAIEMSLNLIIMLIIGMVVLGLVIGFVNSLVAKGTESFDKELGDNKRLKLDEVRNCPNNLCVNPSPSVSVKKGEKTNIFVKVRAFSDIIECTPGDLSNCGSVNYEVYDSEGAPTDLLVLAGPGFTAQDGGEDAQMYTLKTNTDSDAPIGTYYMTLNLYPGEDSQTTKTLTVDVS